MFFNSFRGVELLKLDLYLTQGVNGNLSRETNGDVFLFIQSINTGLNPHGYTGHYIDPKNSKLALSHNLLIFDVTSDVTSDYPTILCFSKTNYQHRLGALFSIWHWEKEKHQDKNSPNRDSISNLSLLLCGVMINTLFVKSLDFFLSPLHISLNPPVCRWIQITLLINCRGTCCPAFIWALCVHQALCFWVW